MEGGMSLNYRPDQKKRKQSRRQWLRSRMARPLCKLHGGTAEAHYGVVQPTPPPDGGPMEAPHATPPLRTVTNNGEKAPCGSPSAGMGSGRGWQGGG